MAVRVALTWASMAALACEKRGWAWEVRTVVWTGEDRSCHTGPEDLRT